MIIGGLLSLCHLSLFNSAPTDGPPLMTIQLSSCGLPELVRILVSSAEMSHYSFFSLTEIALVFDSSCGLWSKREDGADEPSVVLEERVRLDERMG